MSVPVTIPSVGESITSGTIAEWHRQDGDSVESGDVLLTLETDKISTEVPAEADGILRIQVEAGEEVEIGATVGKLDPPEEGGGGGGAAPEETKSEEPERLEETRGEPESPEETREESEPSQPSEPERPAATAKQQQPEERPEPSPPPSESSGDEDAEEPSSPAPLAPDQPTFQVVQEPGPEEPPAGEREDTSRVTRSKMTPLRRKIAGHLVAAQQNTASLTTFNECDMSAVINLRKQVQESFVDHHGVKLGFMSFFVKAVVDALQHVPTVNGRIEGEEVVQNRFYDIGIAIGTEKGLIVPVIRDCDRKSFAEIEREIIDYANRANEGKIQLEDLQGGVFTISNGGIYGSLLSTPILNYPQSAILGMHTIQERPVVVDGKVTARPMMYLALTYDHRLIAGKEAVTFLVRCKECIEQPYRLFFGA